MPHGPQPPSTVQPAFDWVNPSTPGHDPFNYLDFIFFDMQTDGLPDSFIGHLFRGNAIRSAVVSGDTITGKGYGLPYAPAWGGDLDHWKASVSFTLTASDPISLTYEVDITADDGDRTHQGNNLTDFYLDSDLSEGYIQFDRGDLEEGQDGRGTALRIEMRRWPDWVMRSLQDALVVPARI